MPGIDTNYLESNFPSFAEKFQGEVVGVEACAGEQTILLKKDKIREVVRFLKEDPALDFAVLMDLFGMDYLKWEPAPAERFAVIYNLYSLSGQTYLRLKVPLPENDAEVESIHDIYRAADWFEREAWDMFGIVFLGHPNLTRILCHSDFEGHPLRKDYPSDQFQSLKKSLPSTGF